VTLPTTIDGIDAAWLTGALSDRWPSVRVANVAHDRVIHGSATKIRLLVEYEPDDGPDRPPSSMWIKIGLERHSRYMAEVAQVYTNEDIAYRHALPLVDIARPDVFHQVVQHEPERAAIVLEDLIAAGASFPAQPEPLTVAQVQAGLNTLSSLHAQTWNDPRAAACGLHLVMSGPVGNLYDSIEAAAPDLFQSVRAFAAPIALHDVERFGAARAAYTGFVQSGPRSMLHGDAHMGNVYSLPDGTVTFLDWQMSCIGNWAHDVAYFLISSLDMPTRRECARGLLVGYLAGLAARGVRAPAFEDAWLAYRKGAYFGFFQFLVNWDSCQPPNYNMAAFARFSDAMIELETYAALGV
jgi:hypothetical protein